MKKIILFLCFGFLMILLLAVAKADEPNKYENLIINVTFNSSAVSSERTDIEADVLLFPLEDERQQLLDFVVQSDGSTTKRNNSVEYEWHSANNVTFGWNAVVRTSFYIAKIEHITFPSQIQDLDEYKKATETIDIDEGIIREANNLAAGKTDWFEAVHKIADYVYNTVTYDKAYANSEQNASWVLKNKRGVCDEYTILFLALVRSVGIPARYVSGVAYSNVEKNFGNHAWAEVYNGKQWIPFDVTFGQFGWLDASHVALSKTVDSKSVNVQYRYTAKKITMSDLYVKADIVGKTRQLAGTDSLEFNIEPLEYNIGAESFLPLKVSVKNKQNYDLPLEIYISKGLEVVGKNSMHIIVPPLMTKTSFFIVKIPEAEHNYLYIATIEARTQFNDIAATSLDFARDYEPMSLETAKELTESLKEPEVDYRYDAVLECKPLHDYYYGEDITINCTVSSNSNAMLNNLSICIKNQCYPFDLPINGITNKNFVFAGNDSSYIARLSNSNITKVQFVPVIIMEKPNLHILDANPKIIDYFGTNISVLLETSSICKGVSLNLNGIIFYLDDINKKTDIPLVVNGKDALSNKLYVKAECKDLRGNIYRDEKKFDIQLTDLPWYAKIWQKIILIFS